MQAFVLHLCLLHVSLPHNREGGSRALRALTAEKVWKMSPKASGPATPKSFQQSQERSKKSSESFLESVGRVVFGVFRKLELWGVPGQQGCARHLRDLFGILGPKGPRDPSKRQANCQHLSIVHRFVYVCVYVCLFAVVRLRLSRIVCLRLRLPKHVPTPLRYNPPSIPPLQRLFTTTHWMSTKSLDEANYRAYCTLRPHYRLHLSLWVGQ